MVSNMNAIGTDIYLFYSATSIFNYKYDTNFYANNSIYIIDEPINKTLISKLLSIYFFKAVIYDNDEIQEYPCYYGDGNQWNLIE